MKTMEYILRRNMHEEARMPNPSDAYVLRINTHEVARMLTPSGTDHDIEQRESHIISIISDYLSVQDPSHVELRIAEDASGHRCDWHISAPNHKAAQDVKSDLEERIGITGLNRWFVSPSDPPSRYWSIGYIYRERDFEC